MMSDAGSPWRAVCETRRMEPVRASDIERDRVVDALAAATAEGRLTLEEPAERTGAALAATSRAELGGSRGAASW